MGGCELSGKAWSAIGHHKVVAEPTNNLQRVTLVLVVSLKGRVFGQLILGSSIAAIFSEFLIIINRIIKEQKYVIMMDNAKAHK